MSFVRVSLGNIYRKNSKYGNYFFDLVKDKSKILSVIEFEKKYKTDHRNIKKDLGYLYNQNGKSKELKVDDDNIDFLKKVYSVLEDEQKNKKLTKTKIKNLWYLIFFIYYKTK